MERTRGETSLEAAARDITLARRIVKALKHAHDWTWILDKVREEMEEGVKHD